VDDRWYKNGLIYEVAVRQFQDSNGDGIGDLAGLTGRLDYLAGLGVTCLWLLPIHPSPWRDDGYDVTDHYGVHPDFGTLGDFVQLVHQAGDRGIRVIIDLVLNHTSTQHPWFQAARVGHPRFRDYYVWSRRRPPDAEKGVVFPGVQKTTWSYDRRARQYYFHRFYDFQPDLNISNPEVREELQRIIGFWIQLGIAGFRVDAVPFLIEPAGAEGPHPAPRFDYLGELSAFMSWRRGDAVLLGEANVERDAIEDYYNAGGIHSLFNFKVNQNLWLALARRDASSLVKALEETAGIPATDQWANFLRNHDEIDLGRLSEDERADVFAEFGPEPGMQLYDRGIRRRAAAMLGADRRRLEQAFSLVLTLPGTPVIYYGDELGIGDDLSLPERHPVRTAMQWTAERNGGFSTARPADVRVPIISTGEFGYRKVNAAAQSRDPDSLLSWMKRAIRARAECPEFGVADWDVIPTRDPSVLALRYGDEVRPLIAIHNLAAEPRRISLRRALGSAPRMTEVFGNRRYEGRAEGGMELDGFGYRWFRVGRDAAAPASGSR
jgi:maltose alpha-D-glucosyltransferase / alpha-amylase